ncbi:MAG: fimbrillin family protein [Bacteroidetes bacterium]|nr:fimbrillin family protein [Bacteroidota bacterium]
MNKHLLFNFLITILILSSCSKNETLNVNKTHNEISINAYLNSSTKANVINTVNFNNFVVYGYLTETTYSGTDLLGIPYIDALKVTREDNSQPWGHNNKYYWPIDNKKLQIFSISPKDDLISDYLTSETTYPTFKYSIGETSEIQKDLIASSLLNQVKPKNDGNLNLIFKHILSQINFSLKGEVKDLKYDVSKIELLNIKNKGTFKFDGTENIGSWSNINGETIYTHNLSDFIIEGTTTKALDKDKAMILMPQENQKTAKIKITYSVINNIQNIKIFEGSKEVNLTSLDWSMNANTRYILTLPSGANKITYTTIINKWSSKNDVVIKTLKLNKTALTLYENKKETLIATLTPKDKPIVYEWTSSDEKVATVDENGEITAHLKGTTIISVKAEGVKAICKLTVINNIIDFSDDNFRNALISDPSININMDENITFEEARLVKTLNI